MSCSDILSLPIIVPTTCIKKPGFLKSVQCVSSSPCSLPNLLEEFKNKAELELERKDSKEEYLSLESIPKRQREPMDSISLNVQRYYSENAMMTPGKNKKLSDEKSGLILIAQKILTVFDIKLVAEVSSQKSKSIFNILKVLVPEIGLFSTQFFSDLKITEFVFVDGESSPTSSGSQAQATFDVKHLDSPVKVLQRLYRVIFNSLLMTKPHIFNEWYEFDNQQGKVERSESLTRLEETFMAIMNDLNRVSMKPRIQVLKVLLTRYCPEITEEWFRIRSLDKKKHTKVSFSLDEW